jgi:hypothetical protein
MWRRRGASGKSTRHEKSPLVFPAGERKRYRGKGSEHPKHPGGEGQVGSFRSGASFAQTRIRRSPTRNRHSHCSPRNMAVSSRAGSVFSPAASAMLVFSTRMIAVAGSPGLCGARRLPQSDQPSPSTFARSPRISAIFPGNRLLFPMNSAEKRVSGAP